MKFSCTEQSLTTFIANWFIRANEVPSPVGRRNFHDDELLHDVLRVFCYFHLDTNEQDAHI